MVKRLGQTCYCWKFVRTNQVERQTRAYRCKMCYNPHEVEDKPKFLPWAMSSYLLNKYSEGSPPSHLTAEDVSMELDHYRIQPTHIT